MGEFKKEKESLEAEKGTCNIRWRKSAPRLWPRPPWELRKKLGLSSKATIMATRTVQNFFKSSWRPWLLMTFDKKATLKPACDISRTVTKPVLKARILS